MIPYITDKEIETLEISPLQCIDWVREAFMIKNECQLPPKMSVHPQGKDFITAMPCLLGGDACRYGVKVVSRVVGRSPSLKSFLTLYDSISGEVLALFETNWITAMRTGAVATLAIDTFRNSHSSIYSFMGLGNVARSTMKCFIARFKNENPTVRLLRYKYQAERFVEEFANEGIKFVICDSIEEFVDGADVIVSCITEANEMIVSDLNLLKPGVLLVPVHTRGFQNCDTVFDHIFGDDTGHIQGFQYFNQFKAFDEIGEVLRGEKPGRKSDYERIISYNIGLGLHDVLYASKIEKIINDKMHT